jgi:hypothetical protein
MLSTVSNMTKNLTIQPDFGSASSPVGEAYRDSGVKISRKAALASLPGALAKLNCYRQSGCLQVRPCEYESFTLQLWFESGRIVGVTDQGEMHELLQMLTRRGWLPQQTAQIVEQFSSQLPQDLGSYLGERGILSQQQLKVLFHAQVLQRVSGLLKCQVPLMKFVPNVRLAYAERTGLNLSISELVLQGLRSLRDWQGLASELPLPQMILSRSLLERPFLRLNALETSVWNLANERDSLMDIAAHLGLGVIEVQQIAYCLEIAGLLEILPPQQGMVCLAANRDDWAALQV